MISPKLAAIVLAILLILVAAGCTKTVEFDVDELSGVKVLTITVSDRKEHTVKQVQITENGEVYLTSSIWMEGNNE